MDYCIFVTASTQVWTQCYCIALFFNLFATTRTKTQVWTYPYLFLLHIMAPKKAAPKPKGKAPPPGKAAPKKKGPADYTREELDQLILGTAALTTIHDVKIRALQSYTQETFLYFLLPSNSDIFVFCDARIKAWKEQIQPEYPHPQGAPRFAVALGLVQGLANIWSALDETAAEMCIKDATQNNIFNCPSALVENCDNTGDMTIMKHFLAFSTFHVTNSGKGCLRLRVQETDHSAEDYPWYDVDVSEIYCNDLLRSWLLIL